MPNHYFGWTSDVNGDGVPEALRYSTELWLPDLDPADAGRRVSSETLERADGGTFVLTRVRSGRYDHAAPGRLVLSWAVADPEFARIALEDHARNRLVSVRYDWRWRQLEVTPSGLADRKATVAAGYLLSATGRAWLSADLVHTCGATDTKIYVSASSGTLTVGSGTSLPVGATLLSNLSIAGDVVTCTSSPTGVANARTCKILRVETRQAGNGLDSLEIELQEVEG
jgi:hypothetical protein